jgi:hypothetical protein
MKNLHRVLNVIGLAGLTGHFILKFTNNLDNYFLLYVSLTLVFFAGYIQSLLYKRKIKKLESEIAKQQTE